MAQPTRMPESRKYNVYLSSTFRDLEVYRREVSKFFDNIKDRFLLRNMETYVPNGQLAVDACLDDVAGCDIYLLLIGRRCGWIPGENPADPDSIAGDDRISITHLEFNKAVETPKCTILVFLCDPNNASLPQDPPDALFDLKQTKLGALRDQANQYKHHATYFTSPDNLVRQVCEALIVTRKDILSPQERANLLTIYHTYCYDRKDQLLDYREKAILTAPFKVFVVPGAECELGESFIYRLGYFNLSFELEKYYLTLNEILYSTTAYPIIRKKFLYDLYDLLAPGQAERETELTPERLVAVAQTARRGPFALYTKLTADYWEAGAPVLRQLIGEFMEAVRKTPPSQFTWFVLVEDVPTETLLPAGGCALAPTPDAPVYVLPPLSAFPKDFVENWVHDYLTTIPSAKRDILRQYFPSLSEIPPTEKLCRTERIERELRGILKKFNREDPDLYDLIET